MLASVLKSGVGIDLYGRPFWRNHARWRQYCLPPYAEWMGFGDHSQRWQSAWQNNADLIDLIGREAGTAEFQHYVAELRDQTDFQPMSSDRSMPGLNSQLYLAPAAASPAASDEGSGSDRTCRVFPAAGWAAIRTSLADASEDVAFIFRSSPFGSVSHSHANNNDFILHVGGRVMAMPTGYYGGALLGYGSDHHAHWVWHTKSHNCVTLSDAPQIMRSHASVGRVENSFEDDKLVYFVGNADASYADRAVRCRRHVLLLKEHTCFALVDEFTAVEGNVSALQWNLHSWNEFEVDETAREFTVRRGDSTLHGYCLYHDNAFFSMTEGWDPPPRAAEHEPEWPQQYHLRFTPTGLVSARNLGVVLAPAHPKLRAAKVETERRGDGSEGARIGEDLVLVNQGGGIEWEGGRTEALVMVRTGGVAYAVTDEGIGRP